MDRRPTDTSPDDALDRDIAVVRDLRWMANHLGDNLGVVAFDRELESLWAAADRRRIAHEGVAR